jgi:GT2 family glycosyltransferase
LEDVFFPSVSIITVNFNGARFLPGLFTSISNLDYPAEKIEVIMVDNNSSDKSCDIVAQMFPSVKIINLSSNMGYAQGNNAGFAAAKGQYFALLNNDCTVDRQWLSGLVKTILEEGRISKAGAAGSKVLFFYSYILLEFETSGQTLCIKDFYINNGQKSGRMGGCSLEENLCKSIRFIRNCSPSSRKKDGTVTSWSLNDGAVLALPLADIESSLELGLEISNNGNAGNIAVNIKNPGDADKSIRVYKGHINEGASKIKISIPEKYNVFKASLVNSCGLEINNSFYARDRGADTIDEGQFDKRAEIFAPSGSSLLVSRKMLEETGYFAKSFFTYYEDMDLFWRARLKGWKVFFSPDSVARHHHCGTGVEWSPSFTYYVLRNRLIAIFRCGWCSLFARAYFAFIAAAVLAIAGCAKEFLRGKRCNRPDIAIRLRIIFGFFYILPKNIISRLKIRSSKKVPDSQIKKWAISF